ncbi:MAG: hypothetical protein IPG82_08425 [Saprospiraceae bacterium]|nr:hypothetical protein [Saprospiraceae bacterium]
MKGIIEKYRDYVVQIATPYNTGTGFALPDDHIIVTNEHVVRDNQEIVVEGRLIAKQIVRVVFWIRNMIWHLSNCLSPLRLISILK